MNIRTFISNIAVMAVIFGIALAISGNKISSNNQPNEHEMVFVQGGTFTMGCTDEQDDDCRDDEKPAHQVTLSSFYIGKYVVTQAQWQTIMGSNPSYFKGDNLPVVTVSWIDVQEFIRRLNAATGKQYRLPTEAEWEYAARGGNQRKEYKYSGSNNVDDVAWHRAANAGMAPHPVGTKQPNELGIYDMSGNIEEWCSDWYDSYSSSAQTNPTGASDGYTRVTRGGSYTFARPVHVSYRSRVTPDNTSRALGFRLALSVN